MIFQLNNMVVDFFFYALCSVIGATIISIGLYAVLWGKATEETEDVGSLESPSTENAPLLQSCRTENFEKKTNGIV
jgi:hypothetical protein